MNQSKCQSEDIAIKSFFLGPQAENSVWLREQWIQILDRWIVWRKSLFPDDGMAISSTDQKDLHFNEIQKRTSDSVDLLLKQLESEMPKFTPRYMGHMIAEASMPALIGHIATLLHNPNMTTRESSKVTVDLETQAIEELAQMAGFPKGASGHFTGGGTVANIEALWRARYRFDNYFSLALTRKAHGIKDDFFSQCHMDETLFRVQKNNYSETELISHSFVKQGPWEIQNQFQELFQKSFKGPLVLVPGNKHFSWQKAVSLLGLGDSSFWSIELNERGIMSVDDLKKKIEMAKTQSRPILMMVSVLGSTELGSVDPIDEIQDLLDSYKKNEGIHIWHHVDAAYGGYYCSMIRGEKPLRTDKDELYKKIQAVSRVDSFTIDPHKLGYVPYSCGAIVMRDKNHYPISTFSAPYLGPESEGRWAFTLEGSRSSTGAVATWLSNRAIGLESSGYGRILEKGIQGRIDLQDKLKTKGASLLIIEPAELNILCFSVLAESLSLKATNQKTRRLYEHFLNSPHFSVSKTSLTIKDYSQLIKKHLQAHKVLKDDDHLFLIRIVMMNPFFVAKELQKNLMEKFVTELFLSL